MTNRHSKKSVTDATQRIRSKQATALIVNALNFDYER